MCCKVHNWHLVIIMSCSSYKSSFFLLTIEVHVKALCTHTARGIKPTAEPFGVGEKWAFSLNLEPWLGEGVVFTMNCTVLRFEVLRFQKERDTCWCPQRFFCTLFSSVSKERQLSSLVRLYWGTGRVLVWFVMYRHRNPNLCRASLVCRRGTVFVL